MLTLSLELCFTVIQIHLKISKNTQINIPSKAVTQKSRTWFVLFAIEPAAAAKSRQSCPTLCDPIDCSPLGSSVPGILQARILEWVAISFSSAWTHAKLLQPCLGLCDPMNSSSPGSSVHGIFQARVLEWGAISSSRC